MMKNIASLIAFYTITSVIALAQIPFKKVIPGYNGSGYVALKDQGNFSIGGREIITVDSNANIGSKFSWYSDSSYEVINQITLTLDDNYIGIGYEETPFFNFGNMIFKSDTNGAIIWKSILDSIYTTSFALICCSDGSILIPGNMDIVNRPFFGYSSLYKVDSTGNIVWHRYYNTNFWQGHTNCLIALDENYILGLPGSTDLGFGLLKLDTAGNVLWCKTYFRASAFLLLQMTENPDGSIMLLGVTNPKTNWNTPQSIFLMKVDSAGSFLWCKSYGDFFGSFYGGSYTMKRAADGGYIISAPITPLIRSGSDLMIIKTDSSGNLEWSRSHGEIGTNETSIDAFPTSDGGYFVVGTTDAGIPGSGYYIVKTDSLGFAGCQEYTDTLIVNNIFTTDSAIAITDTLVPVLTFISSIQDTILPIPPLYNGCLLNTSQSHDFTRSKSYAYPNPSSGKVNIKSSEPFTKGSYLTVYDSMGRIVIQKPVAKEEDKQIDLSGLGRGIYLLRIKEGEKVSESKVVVEY